MGRQFFGNESLIPARGHLKNRFKVIKKIIPESDVYLCGDITKKDEKVVVKVEPIGRYKHSLLEKEKTFYDRLQNCEEFRIVLYYWVGPDHRFLVLAQRGNDLGIHCKNLVKSGEWKDTLLDTYGPQMIKSLETFHSFGLIHTDPKPNNFVLDLKESNKISLIDFNLAKEYKTAEHPKHIPFCEGLERNKIKGNRHYLSVYGHLGDEQSRRDDLIFLGYSFLWMVRGGNLPWSHLKSEELGYLEYNRQLIEWKCKPLKEILAKEGKVYQNLVKYMEYCHELVFDENPDYKYLISLFEN